MKRLNIVLASVVAMMTLGAANSASAMSAAGYGPCYLESKALVNSGFREDASYSPAAIADMAKRDGVTMHGLNKLDPNCLYRLSYSCRVDHGLVRNVFHAVATQRGADVQQADIHWEVTGPLTENTLHVPL